MLHLELADHLLLYYNHSLCYDPCFTVLKLKAQREKLQQTRETEAPKLKNY